MYFSYSLLFFTIAFSAFKINMLGSLTLLIVITSLMILSAVFLSILFSSFFKRKYVALVFMAFSTYPLFLITGYTLPLYTLPVPLQYLSNMFTITPYLNAYVRLTQLGAGFENIKSEILSMGLITFVLFVLALLRLKYLFIKAKQTITSTDIEAS
jgi:ABC-2 type transport system permease protein